MLYPRVRLLNHIKSSSKFFRNSHTFLTESIQKFSFLTCSPAFIFHHLLKTVFNEIWGSISQWFQSAFSFGAVTLNIILVGLLSNVYSGLHTRMCACRCGHTYGGQKTISSRVLAFYFETGSLFLTNYCIHHILCLMHIQGFSSPRKSAWTSDNTLYKIRFKLKSSVHTSFLEPFPQTHLPVPKIRL